MTVFEVTNATADPPPSCHVCGAAMALVTEKPLQYWKCLSCGADSRALVTNGCWACDGERREKRTYPDSQHSCSRGTIYQTAAQPPAGDGLDGLAGRESPQPEASLSSKRPESAGNTLRQAINKEEKVTGALKIGTITDSRVAEPPAGESPRIVTNQIYRALQRLHLAVKAVASIGFEESSPVENAHHASIWNDLNEAQRNAEQKLKYFAEPSVPSATAGTPVHFSMIADEPAGWCWEEDHYPDVPQKISTDISKVTCQECRKHIQTMNDLKKSGGSVPAGEGIVESLNRIDEIIAEGEGRSVPAGGAREFKLNGFSAADIAYRHIGNQGYELAGEIEAFANAYAAERVRREHDKQQHVIEQMNSALGRDMFDKMKMIKELAELRQERDALKLRETHLDEIASLRLQEWMRASEEVKVLKLELEAADNESGISNIQEQYEAQLKVEREARTRAESALGEARRLISELLVSSFGATKLHEEAREFLKSK